MNTPKAALADAFQHRREMLSRGNTVAEYPSELAELVMQALEDAGFMVLASTPATDMRITPGGVQLATFGEVDVTMTTDHWWMDHRTTGMTLTDTDPHGAGVDYISALRWIEARRAEQVRAAAVDRCDPSRGYHSDPHRGCILR